MYHFAYADDLLLVVGGNSRRALERTGQRAVDLVAQWFRDNHLHLSTSETILRHFKAPHRRALFQGRPPHIRLQGVTLHMPPTVVYLGVTFGRMFSITPHLTALADLTRNTFRFYGQTAHSTWGLRFPVLLQYYRSIFLGITSYGVGALGDLIRDVSHHGYLTSMQRQVLLRLTKAYRTASTVSLQIVAGTLPPHFHLPLRYYEYLSLREFRRNRPLGSPPLQD